MSLLSRMAARWRSLLHGSAMERELDDELRGYVEMLVDQKVREGTSPDAARRAALVELGGMEQVKEAVRDVRFGTRLETALRDLRFAARTLAKAPGFTAAAVLALGLGIGANTAIVSVVNSVLLRPLAYQDADRLAVILHRGTNPVAPANYLDWKRQSTVRGHGRRRVLDAQPHGRRPAGKSVGPADDSGRPAHAGSPAASGPVLPAG